MNDEVIKLRFNLTKEVIEAMPEDDYEIIERIQDGEAPRLYKLKALFSNLMLDENGAPIPITQAKKILGKIPVGDWGGVVQKFGDSLQGATIPKEKENSSSLPSQAEATASEFPAGSEN